ncbi:glycosyltransferase family 2 protein, partial [Paraburkholderia sp. BL21I4N1]|uniref:glycosyltransferase n=1 Tax=Paraburkholderia sp. BL21I4N1 TaxID=1938801 RepID=UPI000D4BF151
MNAIATISTAPVLLYALLSTVYKSVQALHGLPTSGPPNSPNVADSNFLPDVDVIVPCFNEQPSTLSACLESVANQDYAGKLRVYVVDDGSANLDAVRPVYDAY